MIVVILGMHRSGTSVASRSLKVFGMNHGDNLYLTGADNAKGHWEDQDLMDLNERILGSIHQVWHSLRPIPPEAWECLASGDLMDAAKRLLEQRLSVNSNYGCKDPRMTLLLPFWDRVFSRMGLDVKYVLCLRAPVDVACSLNARDGFSLSRGICLWIGYMMTAIEVLSSQSRRFAVVSYDAMLVDPPAQLARLSRFLGLPIIEDEFRAFVGEFIDSSLRHHSNSLGGREVSVPALARDIYNFLDARSSVEEFGFRDIDCGRIESLRLWSGDVRMLQATVLEQGDELGVRVAHVAEAQALAARFRSESDQRSTELRQAKADLLRLQQQLVQSKARFRAARLRMDHVGKKLADQDARSQVLRRKLRAKRLRLSEIHASRSWLAARAMEKALRFTGRCFVAPLKLLAWKRY